MVKHMIKQYHTLSKNTRSNMITYGMLILLFVVVQIFSMTGGLSSLITGQLVPICAYIVMAMSLNLTVGVLGELSLGHAGFMSVGAFTGVVVAACLGKSGASAALCLIAACVIGSIMAALVGLLVGIPVLRLRGDYLAIVTLAFGEIIKSIVNNLYVGLDHNGLHASLLNNKLALDEGGSVILGGPMGATITAQISTFTAGFILIVICLTVILNFVNSKTGRAVMALRDNRIAAESVGIDVTKYKLMAFSISAAMAGAAGALFALNFSTVVASKFDFNTSILVLVFVVLGGLGNMRGSIISAILLTILPELLREFQDYRMLVYAVLLIAMMILANNQRTKVYLYKLSNRIKRMFQFKRKDGGEPNV